MSPLRSIRLGVLKEFAQAKMIRELVAEKQHAKEGYHLVARLRSEDRLLCTNRSAAPRLFKTLEAVGIEALKLNITEFTVVGLAPPSRSLR